MASSGSHNIVHAGHTAAKHAAGCMACWQMLAAKNSNHKLEIYWDAIQNCLLHAEGGQLPCVAPNQSQQDT